MPDVPNISKPTVPTSNQAAGSTNKVPTLQDIQATLKEIGQLLESEYRVSPALTFAKQSLRQVVSSLDQELRNVTIEAQEEARKIEATAKKAL